MHSWVTIKTKGGVELQECQRCPAGCLREGGKIVAFDWRYQKHPHSNPFAFMGACNPTNMHEVK